MDALQAVLRNVTGDEGRDGGRGVGPSGRDSRARKTNKTTEIVILVKIGYQFWYHHHVILSIMRARGGYPASKRLQTRTAGCVWPTS